MGVKSFVQPRAKGVQQQRSLHLLSRILFPARKAESVDAQDKIASHQLLLRAGFIRQAWNSECRPPPASSAFCRLDSVWSRRFRGSSTGKCIRLVIAPAEIDACKCSLPSMQTFDHWKKSGRLDLMKDDVYFVRDTDLLLAPTHEEEITRLVANEVSSHRQLPLRLYQITPKYRKEARPRGGLLRLREFLMKDLYTFDRTAKEAEETYFQVREAYQRIFNRLRLKFVIAEADTGAIGGVHSHEFHVASPSGEDSVFECTDCRVGKNREVVGSNSDPCCPSCGKEMKPTNGIEIGHIFLLGTKYSSLLGASLDQSGPLQMGCYGIGISRLLSVIAEVSSDEQGLIFPPEVAPYRATIIPTSCNAQGSAATNPDCITVRDEICSYSAQLDQSDILIDDRESISIGRKIKDAYLAGIPYLIFAPSKGGRLEIESRETGKKFYEGPDGVPKILLDSDSSTIKAHVY